MAKFLILFAVSFFTGCAYYGSPLPGLNFVGKLPESVSRFSTADRFAGEMARRSSLVVVGATQSLREEEPLSSRIVSLGEATNDRSAVVTLALYPIKKELRIMIAPRENQIELGLLAQQTFSDLFPGIALEAFDRRRGILGP